MRRGKLTTRELIYVVSHRRPYLFSVRRNFETMVHIVKGNIGMGILTLPMAIRNSGLIFGCFALASIALICVYCMRMLVRSAHKVT